MTANNTILGQSSEATANEAVNKPPVNIPPSHLYIFSQCPRAVVFDCTARKRPIFDRSDSAAGTDKAAQNGRDVHVAIGQAISTALTRGGDPLQNLDITDRPTRDIVRACCDQVVTIYRQLQGEGHSPQVYLEYPITLDSVGISNCCGYVDCSIIADGVLHILDFKAGESHGVQARNKMTLAVYAQGTLAYCGERNIQQVHLHIVQPQTDNYDTWQLSTVELTNYMQHEVIPVIERVNCGEGNFCPGDHCQYCRGCSVCKHRHLLYLSPLVEDYKSLLASESDSLSPGQIGSLVDHLAYSRKWFENLRSTAITMLQAGDVIPGHALRYRPGERFFADADQETVAEILRSAGVDPYKRELLRPIDIERALGPMRYTQLFGKYEQKKKYTTIVPTPESTPPEEAIRVMEQEVAGNV